MTEDETPSYECPMCDGEAEQVGVNEHWLELYCDDCDIKFERAAYGDMGGVSVEDLQNFSEFSG